MRNLSGFFFMVLFLFSGQLHAQEKTDPPCDNGNRTYTKAEYAPVFGNEPSDLQNFFDSAFSNIKKSKISLALTLIIDSTGKASFSGIYYYGGASPIISESDFKEIINAMPLWNPARMKKCNVKSAAGIQMVFDKRTVQVTYLKSQTATD